MLIRARQATILAVVALAFAVAATPAYGAPAWLAPLDLSATGGSAEHPQVAFDGQGNALAVWERSNGTSYVVQGAMRPAATGLWQAPLDLSLAGEDARAVQLALTLQGEAIAVWEGYNGSNFIIRAALRPAASGLWQAPVDLSAAGRDAGEPQVAFDTQGNAIVVWRRYDGEHQIVQAALRPAASGVWQAPVDLSVAGQSAERPSVAVDMRGNVAVVWERHDGKNEIIQGALRPAASGAWGAPENLSAPEQNALDAQVVFDPQGDAIAVWERYDGKTEVVQAAIHPVAGPVWQAPVNLSAGGIIAERPRVAVDPQGNAVAVWERFNGENSAIQAAVRPAAGGLWQAPLDISAPGKTAFNPQVAFDAQGNAIAVWEHSNGTNEIVQAAVRPAVSGTWQTPTDLSAVGQNAERPQVAFDPYGNALAVWQRYNATNRIVQGAGYDAAGPFLNALAIPTAGTAGQALTFSVSPLDVWSALAPTSWSFGDGGAASGSSVVHSFTAPSSYTVTVSGADVLGNTTTASGTIAIAPAPSLRPGPPVVSGARLTNKRFRVATKPTAITALHVPRGTVVRFTLSAPAKLSIAITRPAPGLRHGGLCGAPTPTLKRRHAKRCFRTVVVGTLTRAGERSGPGRLPFSGRIGRRALRPGAYRALLTASNREGRSRPVALAFVIVH
jgi:hypothetical protein